MYATDVTQTDVRQTSDKSIAQDQEPINHHCQTVSAVQDVFVYLDTSAELTPSRTTRGYYGSVSQASQRAGRGQTDIAMNSG